MGLRSKKRNSRGFAPGLFLAGSGLIILGIVSAYWLSGTSYKAKGESEISAVPASVNFEAPNLELLDLDGKPANLNNLRGNIILINNWATWCPPCKAEMPTLQTFYEKYKNRDFTLIAIEAGDPGADVKQFVQSYNLTFPVWLDPDNKSLASFRNDALPSSYVVDRDGIVRLAWTGAINLKMLEKYVVPLMEE